MSDRCPLGYLFCFVVAICDLVHAVDAMYSLSEVLKASGNLL